ncbi:hypothetical protein DJ031_04650 [bacterium endosymbiont of Escarpia laminata]|nr:MAG: hypothetical protein DJ031_04650 [bacterium endosymbiont of Escarpia laminata]
MAHGVARSPQEIGRLTKRQMRLLYNTAIKIDRRKRAENIVDTNAGVVAGDSANEKIEWLLS